jgi:hypothetical protein
MTEPLQALFKELEEFGLRNDAPSSRSLRRSRLAAWCGLAGFTDTFDTNRGGIA